MDRFDLVADMAVDLAAQQVICHAENAVHRCPDFVAHRGQKLGLGLVCDLRPVARLANLFEALFGLFHICGDQRVTGANSEERIGLRHDKASHQRRGFRRGDQAAKLVDRQVARHNQRIMLHQAGDRLFLEKRAAELVGEAQDEFHPVDQPDGPGPVDHGKARDVLVGREQIVDRAAGFVRNDRSVRKIQVVNLHGVRRVVQRN